MHTHGDIALLSTRRRNLASLIDLYESNYYRLFRLVPELCFIEGTVVSKVAGALDLYLIVHEHQRYTSTVSLTYRFEQDGFQPNAGIVVYHDAHAAEMVSFSRRKRYRASPVRRRRPMPDLDRKWEINRFLQKWLGFCHRQGHLFLRATCHSVAYPLPLEPMRDHG